MRSAYAEVVCAGQHGALARFIHRRHAAGGQFDGNCAGLAGFEMDALKAHQRVNRATGLGSMEVGLDHLVSGTLAGIGNRYGCSQRLTGGNGWGREGNGAVGEGGVRESVAEAPQRLAGVVAIGAVLEGVVGKGRQVFGAAVKGKRKPAGGVVVAGEGAGDRRAAFHAGIPCLQNGGRMVFRPGEGQGAAGERDDHDRLARRGHGLEHLLLRRGKRNGGAVAAVEPLDLDGHLFAFQQRRQTDKGDDDIGLSCCGDGLLQLRLRRRLPLERDATPGEVSRVVVEELDRVRSGVVEVDLEANVFEGGGNRWRRRRSARGRLRFFLLRHAAARDLLAVQHEAVELLGGVGEVFIAGNDNKGVGAGRGRLHRAGPAYGVDGRVELRHRRAVAPVGLDVRLRLCRHRLPAPVRIGEELRLEPGAKRGARNGNRHTGRQRRSLRIVDGCAGKPLCNAVDRIHRVNGRAVVVALE